MQATQVLIPFRVGNSVDSGSTANPPTFVVRKKAIDMTKIQTVGKDNLATTFSGSARNL